MTLARFMNYILYTDKRPENISAARWCAMRTSIERKYNEQSLQNNNKRQA
jgi:hypothetical protein